MENKNIELAHAKLFGYTNDICALTGYAFSEEKPGNTLRFTESGLSRFWSVIGWLAGLHDARCPAAERMANDFIRSIIYLSNFGQLDLKQRCGDREYTVPSQIVELRDDGSKHGFSIMWYRFYAIHSDHIAAGKSISSRKHERCEPYIDGNHPAVEYDFCMNGGLIYHGPKDPDVLAKWEPKDYWCWSVHT